MFMSGAVTPVYRNNPSFKVLKYHPTTMEILDYDVYAAPLPNELAAEDAQMQAELANSSSSSSDGSGDGGGDGGGVDGVDGGTGGTGGTNRTGGGSGGNRGNGSSAARVLEWTMFYSARQFYDVDDLRSRSLEALVNRLAENKQGYFDKFYSYAYRAGVVPEVVCGKACRIGYKCLMVSTDELEYGNCVNASAATHKQQEKQKLAGTVLFGALFGSAVLFVTLLAVAISLRKQHCGSRGGKYRTMGNSGGDSGAIELMVYEDDAD